MRNTITTLTLNLIVSESKSHRQALADHIFEIVDLHVGDFGGIEKRIRDYFMSHLKMCIEDPTCDSKYVIFKLGEFYRDYYIEYLPELDVAA